MRAIIFDFADCPKRAGKFYHKIMNEAHGTGFPLRDVFMGFDSTISLKREELIHQIIYSFHESGIFINVGVRGTVYTIWNDEKAPPSCENGAEDELTG